MAYNFVNFQNFSICFFFASYLRRFPLHKSMEISSSTSNSVRPLFTWAGSYWKVITQTIREIGEGEPLWKTMQSCLCTAHVRCDVISFGTISVRYIQLVKQKLVYAYWAAVIVVRYVYAFRNYLYAFLWQSGTPPSAVWRHTPTSLLRTFQASNIGEWYTEKNFWSSSII